MREELQRCIYAKIPNELIFIVWKTVTDILLHNIYNKATTECFLAFFRRPAKTMIPLTQCGVEFLYFEKINFKYWHHGFLEYWNSQKSVSNIWPHFSSLLDEEISKIWKKSNSHDGFMSYLQSSTANSAHLAANFWPALVCPQKATVKFKFFPYFWNLLIK